MMRDMLWNLGNPDTLSREAGYYIGFYELALEFLGHDEEAMHRFEEQFEADEMKRASAGSRPSTGEGGSLSRFTSGLGLR